MATPVTRSTGAAWHDPVTETVAPGIFRMPISLEMDGLHAVNVYALVDGNRVTLIDPGIALERSEDRLVTRLAEAGLTLGDVTDLLVTHAHRDHYTLGVTIRRRFGSRLGIGAGEEENFRALAEIIVQPMRPQVDLLALAGADELAIRIGQSKVIFDLAQWATPDDWISPERAVNVGRTLQAIHTPGHTRGHLVFSDPLTGVLFAGDHVLPHITPSIGFEPAPVRSPLGDYLRSLWLLRSMPDAVLLPGHGPATGSVHQRIDELLDHHDHRLEVTLEAVEKGAATAFDVARILTWTRRRRMVSEMDDFNAMLAVLETLWHLELLAERGRLSRTAEFGRAVTFQVT
jgi:glyoxylase-like metal-dependent hydrolase (beta-lactamase superfamily II)